MIFIFTLHIIPNYTIIYSEHETFYDMAIITSWDMTDPQSILYEGKPVNLGAEELSGTPASAASFATSATIVDMSEESVSVSDL